MVDRPIWWNEELSILEDSLTRFFEAEYLPHEADWEKARIVPRAFWEKAGAAGILGLSLPEEYGGVGGSIHHDAVLFDVLGKLGITGFGIHVHLIAAHYLLAYGSDEQKTRWLPRLASGELIGAIAMTEPGTGSDLKAVKTRAVRDGDDYRLSGSKIFISNGINTNFLMTVTKTGGEGSKGVSLLCVETDGLDGFRRGRNLEKLGQKAQDTAELFFDEARVPVANLLGAEEGRGFYQLMEQLPYERLVLAIGAIGSIDRALDLTRAYTKERTAFGQPIAAFQNTAFKLAECATEARIGRVFVEDCVAKFAAGRLDVPTVSMAKWWTTEKQCEIVDTCLQMFGGYGYMMEYPIARLHADSRVQKIYGGTNEIMKELIARSL
ncbi:acyl-CoA dehydrogenase family protein [Pinisolibacter aquiterrae]|uniref:acyl-CoA dehydrogenase family protein n=1 Tax=Pinisolibacter aquiterrae TaxID=2815579 RepID=UPI001C3CCFCD|nr:acyl-CoA dehydrogenase family protein [Pinisolibacter aquiterrae]MBV5265442.1 acyl-CoA dehydrogenase family protein [Pinisolibacter aquiterrae]MCC8236075.1 acyl-CoA dehydrogenase family protein [Pinisolibacter aquiterrae]